MRTAIIDAALERFRVRLQARIGTSIRLHTPRARIDAAGWTVRIDADDGCGPTVLWIRDPRREGIVRHAAFSLAHPQDDAPQRHAGLRARLRGEAADGVADDLRIMLTAVRPTPPAYTPLDADLARRRLGHDGHHIAALVDAYARAYGASLRAVELPGDAMPSVEFPDVVAQQIFMQAPPALCQDVRNLAYLSDLGFSVDAAGRVTTVPMPEGFVRRRRALDVRGGFSPILISTPRVLLSPRRWLSHIAEGRLPINVSSRVSHRVLAPWRRVAMRMPARIAASWHNHFHALAHDMGVHVLAMHRIRPDDRRTLCEAARRGLTGDRKTVLRTAGFFEEVLARTCRDVLAEVECPEQFDARFAAALPQLLNGLG